ncbi:MAG: hypothetical protein CL607_09975 [Anaerolineaceae bacterium]|nr:hypothetical protein [Anaerolineaceae bacterium]
MPNALSHLTIFYTSHIQGDLALLPRLYTFIQQQITTLGVKPLLLDLGESCTPDVWPCGITGGRSTLIVLDGMGYHAANVEGVLAEGERYKLSGAISLGLVDARYSWRYNVPPVQDDDMVVSLQPTPAIGLNIVLASTPATTLQDRVLHLQSVQKRQLGIVTIDLKGEPQLQSQSVLDMPPNLSPDATISAAVSFVEDEARYLENR